MANTSNQNYQVDPSKVVYLSVVIGDAQLGASMAELDGVPLGYGKLLTLAVGHGSQLAGKCLGIKSIVSDVNDATNQTSVTYFLTGGATDSVYLLQEPVAYNGGSMDYHFDVTFF